NIADAEPNPIYINIIPGTLSKFNLPIMFTRGNIIDWNVTNIEDININNIIILILELVLCNIHAAIDANTTINAILIIVINKVFPNTFIKSNFSNALV